MLAKALKSFKDAGDFDASILEWEARPAIAQTFGNFMVVMYAEFSKLNRQDATTARATGHASANNVVEQMAKATEELVAELTERQVGHLFETKHAGVKGECLGLVVDHHADELELHNVPLVIRSTAVRRERSRGDRVRCRRTRGHGSPVCSLDASVLCSHY